MRRQFLIPTLATLLLVSPQIFAQDETTNITVKCPAPNAIEFSQPFGKQRPSYHASSDDGLKQALGYFSNWSNEAAIISPAGEPKAKDLSRSQVENSTLKCTYNAENTTSNNFTLYSTPNTPTDPKVVTTIICDKTSELGLFKCQVAKKQKN